MAHATIHADGVRLCPTSADDVACLTEFFAQPDVQKWWPTEPNDFEAKYIGARRPVVECFTVRTVSGEVLGFIQYHVVDDREGGLDLVVDPSARRRGTGRAAVAALVAFLRRERGWDRITVDPDVSNERAVAFWQAVGFVTERRIDNDPAREPYFVMRLPNELATITS